VGIMTDKASTPARIVDRWIKNAQHNARRMERYQKALDQFTSGVDEHVRRLEKHAAKLAAHERALKNRKPDGS
jgi:nitrate/nitrite-specific signal transduction histidine kinase